jgi:purine-nucleoside/S-methyl-5'-thioadenosine phosphorylase / adenosine deaminase
MIALAGLGADSGVRHAFFTRRCGVSDGLFRSLNCGFGSGDADASVARNRAIAMDRLGLSVDRLVTCRQIHSAAVVAVTRPWPRQDAPRADGMVTRVPGIALGVLAADCAPILLRDPIARVIGAAHGGWRGAFAGITEATIVAMEALGAERRRVRAGIGPCIGPASYEVGAEFPRPIVAEDADAAVYFAPARRPGHWLFDLSGYVAHRLARCGVTRIERAARDTLAEADDFFSYRRACLRGEPVYGRALSAIMIEE